MELKQRLRKFHRFWKSVELYEIFVIGSFLIIAPISISFDKISSSKIGSLLLIMTLVQFCLIGLIHSSLTGIERHFCRKLVLPFEEQFDTLDLEELLRLTHLLGFEQEKLRTALMEKLRQNARRPVNKTCREIILQILKSYKEESNPNAMRSLAGGFSERNGLTSVVNALYREMPSNMESVLYTGQL